MAIVGLSTGWVGRYVLFTMIQAVESQSAVHRFRLYQRERLPIGLIVPIGVLGGASLVVLAAQLAGATVQLGHIALVCACVVCLLALHRAVADIAAYHRHVAHHPTSAMATGAVGRRDLVAIACGLAVTALALHGLFAMAVPPALVMAIAAILGVGAVSALTTPVDRPRVGLTAGTRAVSYLAIAYFAASSGWALGTPTTVAIALPGFAFVGGLAWEFARDIRGPRDEVPGDAAISDVWGPLPTILAWFVLMMAAGSLIAWVALPLPYAWIMAIVIDVTLLIAAGFGVAYLRDPSARRGQWVAGYTVAWTLGLPAILACRIQVL